MKFLKYSLLGLVLLGGCKSCDHEDACPSTRKTNANFFIYEWDQGTSQELVGGGDYLKPWWGQSLDTDTTCTNWVQFVAEDQNADRYQWIIGLDTFTSKSVFLAGFGNTKPEGIKIPVQLTIWKKPDRNCFPDDSGIAVMNRTLTALYHHRSLLFDNSYLITLENGDTMTFRCYYRTDLPGSSDYDATTGVHPQEQIVPMDSWAFGLKKAAFTYSRYPNNPDGEGNWGIGRVSVKVDPNNWRRITGTYELTKMNQKIIEKRGTFTGIRK